MSIMLPLRILAQDIHIPVTILALLPGSQLRDRISCLRRGANEQGVACLEQFLLRSSFLGRNRPVTEKTTYRELDQAAIAEEENFNQLFEGLPFRCRDAGRIRAPIETATTVKTSDIKSK